MKVTGCGSGLSPGSRAEAFPAREGGRRGRGCREQQPSTAGEDTGRMFNQGREGGPACPDLQPRASGSRDGRNGCKGEREAARGEHRLLPCASGNAPGSPQPPQERGGRSQSPRYEGRGGRAALHFQHSCSVLQRLVLAPLLLPYCFQKH